jgi:hypothetical protein
LLWKSKMEKGWVFSCPQNELSWRVISKRLLDGARWTIRSAHLIDCYESGSDRTPFGDWITRCFACCFPLTRMRLVIAWKST